MGNHDFSILALSTSGTNVNSNVNSNSDTHTNSNSNHWYRWISNRYYMDSKLNEYKGSIDNADWSDGSVCQLRLFGVTESKRLIHDYYSGIGTLRIDIDVDMDIDMENDSSGTNADTTPKPKPKPPTPTPILQPIPCYYNSLKGNWIGQKDFLRFAIYCPILLEQIHMSMEASVEMKELYHGLQANNNSSSSSSSTRCAVFNNNKYKYHIQLYSSSVQTNQTFDRVTTDTHKNSGNGKDNGNGNGIEHSQSYAYRQYNSSAALQHMNRSISTVFQPYDQYKGALPTDSIPNNIANTIICTVQTFSSPITGPNMYLFTKYHSMLGFTVLIYDRFASHYEYIKELIEPYGVIYNGYTPLELLQPYVYNREYIDTQVCVYIYIYRGCVMYLM